MKIKYWFIIITKNSYSQATFLSLKKGEEYTLTIKTLVNGQTVGQITENFNTNNLKNLLVKELSAEKDGKNEEEEEKPAPKEEQEEVKVEDTGTTSGVKDEAF